MTTQGALIFIASDKAHHTDLVLFHGGGKKNPDEIKSRKHLALLIRAYKDVISPNRNKLQIGIDCLKSMTSAGSTKIAGNDHRLGKIFHWQHPDTGKMMPSTHTMWIGALRDKLHELEEEITELALSGVDHGERKVPFPMGAGRLARLLVIPPPEAAAQVPLEMVDQLLGAHK